MLAAEEGNLDVVRSLINHCGADVNHANKVSNNNDNNHCYYTVLLLLQLHMYLGWIHTFDVCCPGRVSRYSPLSTRRLWC